MPSTAHAPDHRAAPASRPRRSRTTWVMAAVVVPVLAVAALLMVLTWPSATAGRDAGREAGIIDVGTQYVDGTVLRTQDTTCEGTVEDVRPDGTVPEQVTCLEVLVRLAGSGREVQVFAPAGTTSAQVPDGTRVIVERYPARDGADETFAWSDFARGVPLGTLALVFLMVTVAVAGWRGLRAVVGLAVAFVVLWTYVLPGLVAGTDALLLALTAAVVIMTVVLYLAHGVSVRTTTALLGTFAGLAVVTLVGSLGAWAARLPAVATEDDYRLAGLLGDNGVEILHGVFLCGLVLAGLGVLNDVTVTQASAVWELRTADPDASWRALFAGGMRIGRDHIASTIYTIAFAYVGASLPVLLLLQVYDMPLGRTLTGGVFAAEIVRTLAGSIGLVLAIPLTTGIAAVAARATPVTARLRREMAEHGHGHAHPA